MDGLWGYAKKVCQFVQLVKSSKLLQQQYTIKLKNTKERQTLKTLPISGKPPNLNHRNKHQIWRVVNQHPFEKLANIKERITAEVSIGTVLKAIHELGKCSLMAVKKPYLPESHIACQLQSSRDHQHWMVNNWQVVIWTDKSVFELGKKSMQRKVWLLPNKKYNIDFMQVNHCLGHWSIMIWGAFCGRFRFNLIIPPKQQ
ncbi:hypothetical protein O181_099905 [Austropuccinia psidii MF-1]|uniref:Transposase Tc1-like domain-containing protein n=1 Tax=Austropuccinia psidii MF-1 TaxID=1389203 RepID=A0A9Q3JBR5_9BASI|nr:hypothetical protein [Austropuccinia psidii MF-1]